MSGKEIGYLRCSTSEQHIFRQLHGVHLDKQYIDYCSGKNLDRPQLKACLDYLRDGDTLHIHELSRFCRSLKDCLNLLDILLAKGITVIFHKENMVFSPNAEANPTQKLYLGILGSIAEFERNLIRERQREGIFLARQRNAYKNVGRKPKLSPEQITEIKAKRAEGITIAKLSRDYAVSRQSIYTAISK